MMGKACSCWSASMECFLLVLLVMHAAIKCTTADPADPARGDANKKAQNRNQNNENAVVGNAVAQQSNGQSKESQGSDNHTENPPKETENQKSQPESNDVSGTAQGGSDAQNKKNGGTKAATKGSTNKNDKKTEKELKDMELKMACNKTSDCAPYNDSACVPDSDGHNRCLCGNNMPPRNGTFCKNISRYVAFPCKDHSQCITNAACLPNDNTKPHVAHPSEPTMLTCQCKEGFNYTKDYSQCLDDLGLLKEEQGGQIMMLQTKLNMLQEEQKKVDKRLENLENSGQDFLPSLTITILMAASMLVVH